MTGGRIPAKIDAWVLRLILIKANRLAGSYGLSISERDDIRQSLLLDCLDRLGRFDDARSCQRTFLFRVVNNGVANLIASQQTECRDYRCCQRSVDEPVIEGQATSLGDTISSDEYESRLGRGALSWCDRVELQIDINRTIGLLPAELAAVALILKSASVVEAARQLAISRATMYRRIGAIREVFIAAGLNQYVHNPSNIGQSQRSVALLPHHQATKARSASNKLWLLNRRRQR